MNSLFPIDEHVIVADLSFGDAGKGTTVDYLASTGRYSTVIRFNGGAQAGHGVVQPDGRRHVFSQFGSGTYHRLPTHLSRFCLIDPIALAAESISLEIEGIVDPFDLISVDKRALLVTPYHKELNKLREEARGDGRHGSCGMGIGETMAYAVDNPAHMAPRIQDCLYPDILRVKLEVLFEYMAQEKSKLSLDHVYKGLIKGRLVPSIDEVIDVCTAFAERIELTDEGYLKDLLQRELCLFEGAQGVLLDEWRGFHPYTTWSTTTFDNAEDLLREAEVTKYYKLGILRTYTTRHGAGPFPTEDERLNLPDTDNGVGQWQGSFRVGHFDLVAHRYAARVSPPDGLMVTHLDRITDDLRMCDRYDIDGQEVHDLMPGTLMDLDHQERLTHFLELVKPHLIPVANWCREIEERMDIPVVLWSWGPTHQDKGVIAHTE